MLDFYKGLSEILEIELADCRSEFKLADADSGWDSLAIISTIALIDELFNCTVSGQALNECIAIADIEKLIEHARIK